MKRSLPILVFCLLSLSVIAQDEEVRITLNNGIIEGLLDRDKGLEKYFGIPFAKPPLGELRWKAPQPVEDWKGVKETKEFGSAPVQANVFGDMIFRSDGQSEDCLYLNVWAPAERTADPLPVLVYFYGGGFVAGDASEPRYDGAAMAQKGMVVVTTNYRLNIFGFFAHPDLSAEASYKASGNYGLLDQQAALQWVQDNISSFGGDPGRVTIAGESAGSISVSAQMASPLSKGLFAGAIGESGAAINPTLAPVPLYKAEQGGLEFTEKSGYNSVEELRKLNTNELFDLYQKSERFGFPSVIDGYFLPKSLPEIFRAGEHAQVPLLLGWNSAETSGRAFMRNASYSEENYIKRVKESFPEDHEEVLKLYPHSSEEEIELSATALASDRFISYSTWKWFDLHRKNSNQPVYRYLYRKVRPPLKDDDHPLELAAESEEQETELSKPVGAPHAAEIEYFMGNLDLIEKFAWTKEDHLVSETIQHYLKNFIKTGDPNSPKLPTWPSAEASDATPPVMIIDVKFEVKKAENENRYLFLDEFYGNH